MWNGQLYEFFPNVNLKLLGGFKQGSQLIVFMI